MNIVKRKAFPILAALVIALVAFIPLFVASAETCAHTYNSKVVDDTLVYYVGGDGAYYKDAIGNKVYIYTAEDSVEPFKAMGNSVIPSADEEGYGTGYFFCEACGSLIVINMKQSATPVVETPAPTVEPTIEPSVEESVVPTVEPTVEEEKPTIGGHVTAWIEKYWGEAVAALSAFFVGAFYAFALPWLKRKLKKIVTAANKNEETTALVVGAINQMIEKLEQIEEAHNKKDAEQDEVAKGALEDIANLKREGDEIREFAYATLNILKTVYANSKNIPQGVKDLVNLKYAKAISATTELTAPTEDTSNEKQNEI
jgi:hypothetical protein